MRVLFWGTPRFALPALETLAASSHELVGLVTAADRPRGRGHRPASPPTKAWVEAEGLPVLQPERPRGEEFLSAISELGPDISVVVAYGHILRPEVLYLPPRGSINLHPSLLPEFRGAAPVEHVILAGKEKTGITIIQMDEGMDSGPILVQSPVPIAEGETAGELEARLAVIGAGLLLEALDGLAAGSLVPKPQDSSGATHAPKINKAEALIHWSKPAVRLAREVRAYNPRPGSFTVWRGERLKVWRAQVEESGEESARPGTILQADSGLVVQAGEGALRLQEVQPAGGRAMEAGAFLRGHEVEVGEVLGEG